MKQEPAKTKPLKGQPHGSSLIRSVLSTIAGLAVVAVVLLLVLASLAPELIGLAKPPAKRAHCQSNLKQVALAHMQYTQDYDEHMPLVAVHDAAISPQRPLGWADALQPYLKSTAPYQCLAQADTATSEPNRNGYTDYWYNARLAGVERTTLRYPASILLNGEGNDGTEAANARYSLSELPAEWQGGDSPAMRHLDGANYSYADGHVKWSKPTAITTKKLDGKNSTFAVR